MKVLVLFEIKRDQRAIRTPPLRKKNPNTILSQTHPIKFLWQPHCLKIGHTSDNKGSGVDKNPRPRDRYCKLYPWGIYGSYRRDARTNNRDGWFDSNLKLLVHFQRPKRDQRDTSPPRPFSPNTQDKNIEIYILLKLVQISDNKTPWSNTPPPPRARGIRSKLCRVGIHGSYRRCSYKH